MGDQIRTLDLIRKATCILHGNSWTLGISLEYVITNSVLPSCIYKRSVHMTFTFPNGDVTLMEITQHSPLSRLARNTKIVNTFSYLISNLSLMAAEGLADSLPGLIINPGLHSLTFITADGRLNQTCIDFFSSLQQIQNRDFPSTWRVWKGDADSLRQLRNPHQLIFTTVDTRITLRHEFVDVLLPCEPAISCSRLIKCRSDAPSWIHRSTSFCRKIWLILPSLPPCYSLTSLAATLPLAALPCVCVYVCVFAHARYSEL